MPDFKIENIPTLHEIASYSTGGKATGKSFSPQLLRDGYNYQQLRYLEQIVRIHMRKPDHIPGFFLQNKAIQWHSGI